MNEGIKTREKANSSQTKKTMMNVEMLFSGNWTRNFG